MEYKEKRSLLAYLVLRGNVKYVVPLVALMSKLNLLRGSLLEQWLL